MMRRILITIEYDGGPFHGWQRQVNGLTVQQVLEEAAHQLTGQETLVQAAGRTDAGVHASGQAAHLDVPEKFDAERVMAALNALVGQQPVSVIAAREVAADFHARFSATGRRYLYRILPRRQPPALDLGRVWHHKTALDTDAMQCAADMLSGRHDFTSFRATHCQADSPVRTLDTLHIASAGAEVHIHAAARSFLHHQVRNMVGTLALVGAGKWQPEQVAEALAACDRSAAGPTAPPDGLYLAAVSYPI
mgnify:CR=1 FL=1